MIYYLTHPPPRKQKFGIYRKSPLSVCLSVCPSVHIVSGSYLLTHLSDLDNISHNCCQWPTGVSWPWPKVISSRLKSQCAHIQNPVGPSLRTAMLDLDSISHNRIMTFTQGHIAKVKVTVYTWQKIVLGPLLKNWMLILVLLCENECQRWDASRYIKARSAFMYIVTRLISDVHFHITGPKLTFKTYNYRHCDTSISPKTADYFPSGGVIATLLGNCEVLCYANMNVTLFRVSANQISVFSITQQSR